MGLRYGWIASRVTETDVITHYAQKYLKDHGTGAAMTDCTAQPGRGLAWIVVRCQPRDVTGHYEYRVNRIGKLIGATGPAPASALAPLT